MNTANRRILRRRISLCLLLAMVFSLCFSFAAQAEEMPEFVFTRESFPVIDGSTSCVPLGKAIAAALLPGEENTDELIEFHKTTQSFRNLASGACDIIISGQPEQAAFDEMEAAGFEYAIKPFATDALIFVVNENNPVNDLSTHQIRDIYSGKITNWKDVGGEDAPIAAFQRNAGAGSQALMLKHVMGDIPMTDPVEDFVATEMGELMTAVKSYDNSANAIGYSVYYYANDMKKAAGLKILSVDGVTPSDETIADGTYPHLNPYYTAIYAGLPGDDPAAVLYSWLTSKAGCSLLQEMGYVPTEPDNTLKFSVPCNISAAIKPEAGYSRRSKERVEDLTASDDYGFLLPYHGIALTTSYEDNTYVAGYLSGLFDSKGEIVTDPVYANASLLSYWNNSTGNVEYLPVWLLRKTEAQILEDHGTWQEIDDQSHYAFAALDGNFVSDCVYESVTGLENAVLAVTNAESSDFTVFDLNGNVLLTDEDLSALKNQFLPQMTVWSIRKSDDRYILELSTGQYLLDLSGNILAGPFEYIGDFSEGYAVITNYTYNTCKLIDHDGKTSIPSGSYKIYPFQNGIAGIAADGVIRFIDKDFHTVCTIPGQYGYVTGYGFCVDGKYYDRSGNAIFPDGEDGWYELLPEGIFWHSDESGVTLFSLSTEEIRLFEGFEYASQLYTLTSSAALPYFTLSRTNENGEWETTVFGSDYTERWHSTSYVYPVEDLVRGEWYLSVSEAGKCTLYDENEKAACEFPVDPMFAEIKIYDGIAVASDQEKVIAVRLSDGEIIFSYSLTMWSE
ncbi:MAG: substrate-binding domain-containing protein [Eubacteriales bacterium]|nr:substrate-binding domain-containing protein [Eubacteriales bacterium]